MRNTLDNLGKYTVKRFKALRSGDTSKYDLPALLSSLEKGDLLRAAAEYCDTGKLPKWLTEMEEVWKPHGTLRDATVMFNTPQYTVTFLAENVMPNRRLLLNNAYINHFDWPSIKDTKNT